MEDSRFKDMFVDKDFEINQDADDYRRLYRKKNVETQEDVVFEESEEEEEEIAPKLKKKRKVEGELVEEPDEKGGDLAFRDRFEEKVEKKIKKKKEKKSKVLKETPDLEGRRTLVPMHKLLKSSNRPNYR